MPELAKHIAIKHKNSKTSINIDGVEFPWFISEHGITINVERTMPSVTFTILTDRVTLEDDGTVNVRGE